ncbi:hypothetical protein L2E82_43056 [Cichorium intybus]|uniref:Uncharacterized protein n=1 Tax=Cichorium intybus TaxID=13427 RepID=A0ACB8ZNC4_CICIN|nr:hypothetical protein L2E82_43056 [Cichorium intybus]
MNKAKCSLKNMKRNLRAREALNESEQKKIDNEKKMNETAILEQMKADDRMLRLADDQKVMLWFKVAPVDWF